MRNRVFHESLQIYLVEGNGFITYAYVLGILALLQFLTLFLPSLDPQVWVGPANLFKVSAVGALMLMAYSGLKVANQEFVPWRFHSLKRWLRQEGLSASEVRRGQIGFLGLHVLILLLLAAPLLLWAGAIARATPLSVLCTLLLLVFYSLIYGLWGLVALVAFENRVESRQVFVRSVFIILVFLSALVSPALNPVAFVLSYLGRMEIAPLMLWGRKWPTAAVHFGFHLLLLAAALAVYRRALKKEDLP